jgi:hypothetical protein
MDYLVLPESVPPACHCPASLSGGLPPAWPLAAALALGRAAEDELTAYASMPRHRLKDWLETSGRER